LANDFFNKHIYHIVIAMPKIMNSIKLILTKMNVISLLLKRAFTFIGAVVNSFVKRKLEYYGFMMNWPDLIQCWS